LVKLYYFCLIIFDILKESYHVAKMRYYISFKYVNKKNY
jgi:hypothetical protein